MDRGLMFSPDESTIVEILIFENILLITQGEERKMTDDSLASDGKRRLF